MGLREEERGRKGKEDEGGKENAGRGNGKGREEKGKKKEREKKRKRGKGEMVPHFLVHWCDVTGQQSKQIPWKKHKIRAITPFKVIEVGINRKPVCDFLLVINSNWYPISYSFGVIAVYCPNFGHFAFWDPLWGGWEGKGQRTMLLLGSLERVQWTSH